MAGLEWMVGVVPVLIGAITALHLSQLLRIQPSGQRDLGRLALVAGAALAFLTVAIPLQLSHQWITIGWALEGAAVAWLYTRIRIAGLLLRAIGLFACRLRAPRAQPGSVPLRAARRHAHRQLVSLHLSDRRRDDGRGARGGSRRPTIELAAPLPRPRHLLPSARGRPVVPAAEHRDRRLLFGRARDPVSLRIEHPAGPDLHDRVADLRHHHCSRPASSRRRSRRASRRWR